MYPTGVRSFFHGISAAAGKVGALVAAVLFSSVRGGGVRLGDGGTAHYRHGTGLWAGVATGLGKLVGLAAVRICFTPTYVD